MLVYRSLGLTARVRRSATLPDPTPASIETETPRENRVEPMPAPVRPEPNGQQSR